MAIAKLVYDGLGAPTIPSEMGSPREDQMMGSPLEQLVELSGRVCYDSLGKGRPSFSSDGVEGYHDHILVSKHTSVLRHANLTVQINTSDDALIALLNLPGVWVRVPGDGKVLVTFNLNTAIDVAGGALPALEGGDFKHAHRLARTIRHAASCAAPNIVKLTDWDGADVFEYRIVEPNHDEERWISMFLSGGRGFSHEMVRHSWRCAVSQRSTRYVDESRSPWTCHPLLEAYRRDVPDAELIFGEISTVYTAATGLYASIVEELQSWLVKRGVDKLTARKQARGAARNYLGNGLETEMIFSASVAQWRRMIQQRANAAADAEIRAVFSHVIRELKTSRYADRFADIVLEPSPDGIGEVVNQRGAASRDAGDQAS